MGPTPRRESASGVLAFIQARMSSSRFPGKTLAPFRGVPVIRRVVERVAQAVGPDAVVVATSDEPSDDPLAAYLGRLGVPIYRGPLADVFARYREALEAYPCDWFLRVTGDSVASSPTIIRRVLAASRDGCDLVTTTWPRTFPVGQNAELLLAETFRSIPTDALTDEEREHLTRHYYEHADRFRIRAVLADRPGGERERWAVDTVDDLRRLEAMPEEAFERYAGSGPAAAPERRSGEGTCGSPS